MSGTDVIWLIVLIAAVAAVVVYLVRVRPGPRPGSGDGLAGTMDETESAHGSGPAPAPTTRRASPMDAEADPLGAHFEAPAEAPQLADSVPRDAMSPAGSFVTIPDAWASQLREQGISLEGSSAADVVLGVLRAAGYNTNPKGANEYEITKGRATTYLLVDPYDEAAHPEMDESDITRFVMAFINSKADNGLYVTDKFAPFSVYDREKRDKRIRFVSRERIQQFVNGITGA